MKNRHNECMFVQRFPKSDQRSTSFRNTSCVTYSTGQTRNKSSCALLL